MGNVYIYILESSGRPPGRLDSTKRLVGNPTNHVRTGTETKFGLRRPRCAPHSTELEAVACSRQPARERTGAQTGCSSLLEPQGRSKWLLGPAHVGAGESTQRLSHQNNIPGPRLPPEHQRHTKKMHGGSERCTPSKLGAFLRILWYLRHGYGDFWCLKPDTRQARWLHCDSPGHHRELQRHLGPHKRTPWASDFTFYYL